MIQADKRTDCEAVYSGGYCRYCRCEAGDYRRYALPTRFAGQFGASDFSGASDLHGH